MALKLAGDRPGRAPHMALAADWIAANGRSHRDPRLHQDLAQRSVLAGPRDDLPVIPPEVIYQGPGSR